MQIIDFVRRWAHKDALKVHDVHSQDHLIAIGKQRDSKFDEKNIETAWCQRCGAPLSLQGIIHWPDCDGYDADIRFKKKVAS